MIEAFKEPEFFPSVPLDCPGRKEVSRFTRFVYVIQAGLTGPVKIGVARDPFARLESLQSANFYGLRLLFFEDFGGRAFKIERGLHRRFRDFKVRGEWFSLDTGLRRYLMNVYYGDSLDQFIADERAARMIELQ